jgi:site-specific DNA-cytosine methylase
MKPSTLLSALLVAALPGVATAAHDIDSTKRIDKRQETQEQRIEKGVKSKDLSKKEAARLEEQQRSIEAAEKKAMADKKMTAEERARIERMQDKQSRAIRSERQEKHGSAAGKASASAGASTAATAATAGKLGTIPRAEQDAFIRAEEQKALADGFVSAQERARLKGYYDQVPSPERFRLYREPGEKSRD